MKLYSNKIAYKKSAYFWAISELKRYIPGNVWGFLGRALVFSDLGIDKKTVGKLIAVEAGTFVVGATVISLLSLPFIFTHFIPILKTYQTAIFLIVFLLICFYVLRRGPMRVFMDFPPSFKIQLVFLNTVAVFFLGIGYYFVISSFIPLNMQLVFQLTGFFVLSVLIGALSFLTPAGFGVREGFLIAGLSKIVQVGHSAFGALLGRVILIASELIFILFSYLWHKIHNEKILLIERWIANHKHETVLIFLTLVYFFYFTTVSFLRHDNFYTGRFDLGNMAQTVWNTTQGRIFQFSNPHGTEMISRLAFHADFLLVLLSPFYALFPSPKTLLFIQTFVVAGGGFFVYQIAKDKLKDKNLSLALAFSFLLSPAVQRSNMYDFHAVTLATTFLLATYYFYSKKKYAWFLIFAILSALSKEQIWLIVALFGGLIFFKHKKRIFGSALFMISIFMFCYLISIAIPKALGSSHFALTYYSDFGDGPVSIIKTIVFSPGKIIDLIFEKARINYLTQLFSHVGYLPIFFPFFLIFAGPDLLINLLSNNAQLHQIYYHYTAAITPFIYLSTIFSFSLIRKFFPKQLYSLLTIFILSTALISAYKYGPLPGSKDSNLDMFIKQVKDAEFIEAQLSSIPADLSVASSNNVGSHLTHRKALYTLPLGIDTADVIVFFLTNSEQPESLKTEKIQLQKLKGNKDYKTISEKGKFVIFKRK